VQEAIWKAQQEAKLKQEKVGDEESDFPTCESRFRKIATSPFVKADYWLENDEKVQEAIRKGKKKRSSRRRRWVVLRL
jgi:hypothetical protein